MDASQLRDAYRPPPEQLEVTPAPSGVLKEHHQVIQRAIAGSQIGSVLALSVCAVGALVLIMGLTDLPVAALMQKYRKALLPGLIPSLIAAAALFGLAAYRLKRVPGPHRVYGIASFVLLGLGSAGLLATLGFLFSQRPVTGLTKLFIASVLAAYLFGAAMNILSFRRLMEPWASQRLSTQIVASMVVFAIAAATSSLVALRLISYQLEETAMAVVVGLMSLGFLLKAHALRQIHLLLDRCIKQTESTS